MLHKLRQASSFLIISFFSMALYGVILYFVYTWLAGYSPLYAFIGNLIVMIAILALDESMQKTLQSEKFIRRMQKEKDPEKTYRSLQKGLRSVGSFKADMYLFYIFILLFSRIMEYSPEVLGENLSGFIHANEYSIMFLLAFDTWLGQFSKDRTMMGKVLAKLKKSLSEGHDKEEAGTQNISSDDSGEA